MARIGVHRVISPQEAMGRRTADLLMKPWLSLFWDFGDDIHVAGRFLAPDTMLGKPLRKLDLQKRYGMTIISVVRGNDIILPSANLVLEEGDEVQVFGDKQRMSPLLKQVNSDDLGDLVL